ncbi:unnamed protein product [Ixodes persulcatus]
MLNCCIERKKKRERRQLQTSESAAQQKSGSSESDEEIFYECPDDVDASSDTADAVSAHSLKDGGDTSGGLFFFPYFMNVNGEKNRRQKTKGKKMKCAHDSSIRTSTLDSFITDSQDKSREGILRRCGDMTLLETGEPLQIPVTQEPSPMTEDMLEQHADALVKLGSNPEGAVLRARMQSACLFSDMEAFKVGDRATALISWASDFTWVAPVLQCLHAEPAQRACLSRVQSLHKTLQELFDPGSRCLALMRSGSFFCVCVFSLYLACRPGKHVPLVCFLSYARQLHFAYNFGNQLATERSGMVSVSIEQPLSPLAQRSTHNYKPAEELLGLLYEAEVAVARLESLRKKFGAGQEAADKLAASPGYIAQRRSHSSGTARLADTKKQAANQVDDFVLELVDNTEVEVSGAGGGPIGRTITQLFCESQKGSDSASESEEDQEPKFASPAGREYILRARCACPTPAARATPQRLYCVVAGNDFRLAGAFTHDAVFY